MSGDGQRVIVVGAGPIGLAAALELRRRGANVSVMDPDPGGSAAFASGGLVMASESGHADLDALSTEAAAGFPTYVDLIQELSGRSIHRAFGLLRVTHGGASRLESTRAMLDTALGGAELVDANQVRDLAPLLVGVTHGLYSAGEGTVIPAELLTAMLAGFTRLGGDHVPYGVQRVLVRSGRAQGVQLHDGRILPADLVVVCAGAHSARIAGLPPPASAVVPVRGLTADLRGGVAVDHGHPVLCVDSGSAVGILPARGAVLRVGATVAQVGWSRSTTVGEKVGLLNRATTLMPTLNGFDVDRWNLGFRPLVGDGLPVVSTPEAGGLLVVTGHYRSGVALAAVTAQAIGQLAYDDPVPPERQWLLESRQRHEREEARR